MPLKRLTARCLAAALALGGASGAVWAQEGQYPLIVPQETISAPALTSLKSLFGLSDDADTLAALPVRQMPGTSLVIGLDADSGNPTLPWCAERSGLLRIGRLGSECLMSGRLELELPGQINAVQAGLAWQGESLDFGLNYGWSWQEQAIDTVAPVIAPLRNDLHPSLPSIAQGFDSQALGAHAQWRLTSRSAVQLNAALTQLKLWSGNARPVWDLDQAALGMGLRYGPFGGNVRGRVGRLHDPLNPAMGSFGGLDIGVSWRTPWAGELTVGADNLVLKRDEETQGNRAIDEATARTPYVLYKQDL